MSHFYRAGMALVLAALFVLPLSTDRVSALTIGYGDTVSVASCTDVDPCSFGGSLAVGYFGGVFDHFFGTLTGTAGQTLSLPLTAAVDMQVVTSGVGGSPLGTDGSGGSGVYDLLAGVTQTLNLMFDTGGLLTLNTITPTGAVADAGGLFGEFDPAGTGLAFNVDVSTGLGFFGPPQTGTGGTGGTGGIGGVGGEVPLPASVLLLLGALGGFGIMRRRQTATA